MLYNKNMLAALEPFDIRRVEIPNGYRGTTATIQQMAALVKKDVGNWFLMQVARDIVKESRAANMDYEAEAAAIFNYVKGNVRFIRDPYGMEHIQSAFKTLEAEAGDCDDHSILNAVLLNSIGFPVRFVTIKRGGPEFVHVFVETKIPRKGWTTFDTTIPESYFGWKPQGTAYETWKIGDLSSDTEGTDGVGFLPLIAAAVSIGAGLYQQKQAEKAAEKQADADAAAEAAYLAAEREQVGQIEEAAARTALAKKMAMGPPPLPGTLAALIPQEYKMPLLIVGVGTVALVMAYMIMRKRK